MRKIVLLAVCFILLVPLIMPGRLTAAPIIEQTTGLLVQVSAAPGDESDLRATLNRLAQAQGMEVVRVWPHLSAGLLRPSATLTRGAITDTQFITARQQALRADPAVVLVEVDAPVYAADALPARALSVQTGIFDQPNDPSLPEQYALSRINVFGGWGISQGSPAVAVAVIDSGYDLDHEDIDQSSVWVNQAEAAGLPGVDDDDNGYVDDINGWDFIGNDGITDDPYGHGTHVGGVIGASTDNGVGVASVGRNLRVMPLRILDQYGRGSISGLLDALAYATEKGVRVINLSLVTTTSSATLHDSIRAVASQGILIVAAAGNAGASVTNYFPAAWPEVFTVAATDNADKVTLFSNYGEAVDVGAPGSLILSTYKNNSYYMNSGTSMATPHVSALAGLLLSLRPDLSLAQLTDLIRATAQDVNAINYPGRDNYLGDGRIDVLSALSAASSGVQLSAGGENLLPTEGTGIVQVAVSAGPDAQPVQGAVLAYALHAEADSQILLSGALLTGPALTNTISLTVPITGPIPVGMYILESSVGQASARLPVYVYAAPLSPSLSTDHELTAQDQSLSFVLKVVDGNGVNLPVPIRVRLHTNVGLFSNEALEIEVQAINGQYMGTVHGWSIVDLLNENMVIEASILATGQTVSIQVPVKTYRTYFPWVPISVMQ